MKESVSDTGIRLRVLGDDGKAMASLHSELVTYDELRGFVKVLPAAEGRSGTMGSAWSDTLMVAFGSGGAGTVLAYALLHWVKRPQGADVRLAILRADGSQMLFEGDRLDNVASVIEALETASSAEGLQ